MCLFLLYYILMIPNDSSLIQKVPRRFIILLYFSIVDCCMFLIQISWQFNLSSLKLCIYFTSVVFRGRRHVSDIDECFEEAALCGAGDLMCVNLEGSYKCTCPPGYTAQGGACVSEYMCPLPLVTPATRPRGAPVLVSTYVPYPLTPRLHGPGRRLC